MATSGTSCCLQEELKIFHNIDRLAYTRLVFHLGLPPKIGSKIVAFWNWLERIGYVNFVDNSLDLSPPLFLELSRESEACLDCLKRESFSDSDERLLPLISSLAGEPLSLKVVYENKLHATRHMKEFNRDVGKRIFYDITPTRSSANGDLVNVCEYYGNLQGQDEQADHNNNGSHNIYNVPDNKTLFATFSKGHPITYQELEEFFTRRYGGDCIENIYMSELFARVVVTSPKYITRILGETEILQSNIHGKDVRIRRFIPRGPPHHQSDLNYSTKSATGVCSTT